MNKKEILALIKSEKAEKGYELDDMVPLEEIESWKGQKWYHGARFSFFYEHARYNFYKKDFQSCLKYCKEAKKSLPYLGDFLKADALDLERWEKMSKIMLI